MKLIRTTLCAAAALAATILVVAPVPAAADQCFADDVVIDGSQCIGFDCVCNMTFGFDTLVLKENNLRIFFDDTSTSASFPNRDWRIVINSTANGGGEYFGIEDSTAGRMPFRVEGNAPSDALYVKSSGDVGFGTSVPVVNLHVVDGNTPTLRLEQNGSSGFTPQTWDVAGNEANFFIRDVTNGSKLPFRITPNAETNSIYIGSGFDVGFGTNAPDADTGIHVKQSGLVLPTFQSSNNSAVQFRIKTTGPTNRRVVGLDGNNSVQSQIIFGDAGRLEFIGETNASGVCLRFRDSDDAGDTYCEFLNGVISCSTTPC